MSTQSIYKRQQLDEWLTLVGSVVIAYSGGIDSTYLLHRAKKILGTNQVYAVVIDSELIPQKETQASIQQAEVLGVQVYCIPIDELNHPAIAHNRADSWYWIKHRMFDAICHFARGQGIATVADGTIVDDLSEFRPGLRARDEWGVKSPLALANFTKDDVRFLAREEGLEQWAKPSACSVISRFVPNTLVTREMVQQVIQAEEYLQHIGITSGRVRHHGNLARIEVKSEDILKLFEKRQEVQAQLERIGFAFVAMDLKGYQSGNMTKDVKERSDV
ncbi:ATP-dependent sacrificial sulfur transferase LarE [Aerococcaceae bacterium NML190938]|nr:ATP-dependent sacrificial sulfur transferase LarE [Aerococcaceae bacterium NML190938]